MNETEVIMVKELNYNTNIILEIQNYLINIRSIHPSLPTLYPTGVYDAQTRKAVHEFQNIKGLPATGSVDILTWNELIRENDEHVKRNHKPGKMPVATHDFEDVKRGDERDIVYAIKIMLNSFYKRYSNYHKLEITNLYNMETEEAVIMFQQRSMLPVTGIIDKSTWNTLVKIYDSCRLYK
jgi:peptidoglycan hydrolase-like protein with peptidoglycan-binding domain